MIARLRFLVLVAVAIVAVPAAARGQQSDALSTSPSAGPRLDATATAARSPTHASLDNLVSLQRRTRAESQSVALMIVGGAAVVLGAVIGDDVGTLFMIGGAVALLIGLYRYLQ